MEKTKRLITSVLTAAMLFAAAVPAFAADGGTGTGTESTGTASFIESINTIAYDGYLEKHKDAPVGKGEIVINGVDFDKKATTATVSKEKNIYGYEGDVLRTSDEKAVVWSFDVKDAGMYNITIEYAAMRKEAKTTDPDGKALVTSNPNNIERVISINGDVPFSESRLISMKKTWSYDYMYNEEMGETRFEVDAGGNELRPASVFIEKWESITLADPSTYYIDPFEYYFNEGTNTIALEGVREEAYIKCIKLHRVDALPSYNDVLNEYNAKGYTQANAETIHINGETPYAVSSSTIIPNYDRSSAITEPQHPTAIKRNIIGGSNWSNTSDWVKYKFSVETSGLYTIVVRYKQDSIPGSFVSRAVKIDGEYPFAEARLCTFEYGQDWQVKAIGSGDMEFQFYLEGGMEHEIEFMATVGSFGEVLTQVEDVADKMNDAYLQIVKLTGPYPDVYRDYGFNRVMPEAIAALSESAEDLQAIIDYIAELSGGSAYNTANLDSAVLTLNKMLESERNIAENLSLMKSDISNLSTWCSNLESQPLMIDFIDVQSDGGELPRAAAGFMESIKYEIGQFIGSFYTDYNSFQEAEDGEVVDRPSIECWMSSGRDRATIIRDLINSGFCEKEGINVSVKLVDASALLPSVLAGIGPDVSLDGVATIDYALRDAVKELNGMPGFDEVIQRFEKSTVEPLSLYGKTYALPVSVDFPMMFVRKDILANLGVEAPKTWDDFLALIPVLQYNNMTVILPNDSKTFIYQAGGDVWDQTSEDVKEHGWRTTFDDDLTLTKFTEMCNMFTQYSLLVSADFQTRFKTGVAPVAITSYSSYTALSVFAPEIAGLWEMQPIPGTVVGQDENGNDIINNTAIATTTGISILRGCSDVESTWKFLCWYTDGDFQVDLCNEMISLLGPSAKTTTANKNAMWDMPWSKTECESLLKQYANTVGVPQYPGHYVIERYLGMAFQAAYNDGEIPSEALLQYVSAANQEISRKRTEFDQPIFVADEDAK